MAFGVALVVLLALLFVATDAVVVGVELSSSATVHGVTLDAVCALIPATYAGVTNGEIVSFGLRKRRAALPNS